MDKRTPLDEDAERTSRTGVCRDWGKENFNASITEEETQETNK